jgi:hypothetical protein
MDHSEKTLELRIPRFGSVIGLIFEDGGSAEVLMTFPELHKLLDLWMEYERGKSEPDSQLIGALE